MGSPVLVAGLDSRGLGLEAPVLRRDGHPVLELPSGRALLEALGNFNGRLVVLGPRLDDTTVLELITRIRSGLRTRRLSLMVLLPSEEAPGLEEKARLLGANAVLRRPLQPGALESWVAKLMAVPRRVETRAPITAQLVGTRRSGPGHFSGLTVNLSVNGLLLASPIRLSDVPDLDLEFSLPGLGRPLSALARVVREAPEVGWPYVGYGVEFLFVPDATQDAILAYIEGVQEAMAAAADRDFGIHCTLRREEWVYEILTPETSPAGWQVQIRRAPRESWRRPPPSARPWTKRAPSCCAMAERGRTARPARR